MSRWLLAAVAAAGVLTFAAPASAAERLNAYTAVVSGKQLAILSEQGLLDHGAHQVAGGTKVSLVLTRAQRAKLAIFSPRTRWTTWARCCASRSS